MSNIPELSRKRVTVYVQDSVQLDNLKAVRLQNIKLALPETF